MIERTIVIHNVNFGEFIKLVDKCKGNVLLKTDDGNILNLKSKLCQLVSLYSVLNDADIKEAKIVCENEEDESILFRYNLYQNY